MSSENPTENAESGLGAAAQTDPKPLHTGGSSDAGETVADPVGSRTEVDAEPSAALTEVDAEPSAALDRPSYLFFGVVAAVSLLLDVLTKAWADIAFNRDAAGAPIEVIKGHLSFTLAYNKGGAWGLLQDANEAIRRPFFLLVSAVAIVFIVSLYGKLHRAQWALKWGLPLVLGGALGNLADRVTRVGVVDFIDYRADWVASMNRGIAFISKSIGLHDNWTVTDHWPTFNVADIAICIGVGLMAIDMFLSRREPEVAPHEEPPTPGPSSGPSVDRQNLELDPALASKPRLSDPA